MANTMVNYYAELGLDPGASQEQLEANLKALRRTWTSRASTAADPSKRQQAEQKVVMIREATEILLDKKKREKYDKQLDKKGASSAAPQEYEAPSAASASFMDNAALMDMLESCYNNSKYNQAIAAANKLIENGAANVDVYRYLILCYAEKGDESKAYQTLKRLENALPDSEDALLLIATVLLRVLQGREAEAKPYLEKLANLGYGDTSDVVALDVEYQIDSGNMEVAEQKTNAFISKYGKDTNFCINVANAYVQAANKNATEFGGDVYFETKEAFDKFATLVDKANSIYTFEGNDKLIKEYKKTTMVEGWWIGVLCLLLYGFAGMAVSPVVGILCFAGAVVLFYFSRVPNWMAIRFQYKKHLIGLYEVFRIINIIFSLWWRIGWAIFKFIFGIIFAFV